MLVAYFLHNDEYMLYDGLVVLFVTASGRCLESWVVHEIFIWSHGGLQMYTHDTLNDNFTSTIPIRA